MNPFDQRTVDDSQISFYVFDDLRFQQNGRGRPVVYRYDDLSSALAKYLELPADMTSALGMHLNARAELDLVHRREGEHVLVTDYLNFPHWRNNPETLQSVAKLCDSLNIQWQMDSKCMPGMTILTPLESGFERIPDNVFAEKALLPKKPDLFQAKADPNTAINEAYVEGEGWVPYSAFRKKAEAFGFKDPHCVQVRQFNVNYQDRDGHTGQADVYPMDMQILQERYQLQHGDEYTVKRSIERLSEEVSELLVKGPEQENYKQLLQKELSRGNFASTIDALDTMCNYGGTDQDIAAAYRLKARVHSLSWMERPSLVSQMCTAAAKAAAQLKGNPDHEISGPER